MAVLPPGALNMPYGNSISKRNYVCFKLMLDYGCRCQYRASALWSLTERPPEVRTWQRSCADPAGFAGLLLGLLCTPNGPRRTALAQAACFTTALYMWTSRREVHETLPGAHRGDLVVAASAMMNCTAYGGCFDSLKTWVDRTCTACLLRHPCRADDLLCKGHEWKAVISIASIRVTSRRSVRGIDALWLAPGGPWRRASTVRS